MKDLLKDIRSFLPKVPFVEEQDDDQDIPQLISHAEVSEDETPLFV